MYVPAGPAWVGGDPNVFYPEPRRRVELRDYFISRYEVTFDEYFEFLRDPETLASIRANGALHESELLPFEVADSNR